jgi:hypothetical protein
MEFRIKRYGINTKIVFFLMCCIVYLLTYRVCKMEFRIKRYGINTKIVFVLMCCIVYLLTYRVCKMDFSIKHYGINTKIVFFLMCYIVYLLTYNEIHLLFHAFPPKILYRSHFINLGLIKQFSVSHSYNFLVV